MPQVKGLVQIGVDEAGNIVTQCQCDVTAALGLMEQAKFALLNQVQQQPVKKMVVPQIIPNGLRA